ncbi:MAG: isoleucine--tRNA ligase [Candidatus Omnitrophica bacterium]|nr:isoleucine--tRNA ligase [Candidatus Omnitrophota bacterium]
MDYKNTLNLPQTDFPMKANLAAREPLLLAEWEKLDIYKRLREFDKGRKLFILHDGPPYANGHIHIGHALNKILKDIIVRYKSMRGYDAPYIPGWDCHGLPVEHQLFKELKITKDQIDRVSFRKKAHDYAVKFVDIQKEEFKRLGIVSDWDKPYLTLDRGYEHAILKSFAQLVKKGFVYRGLKPVNWCFKCETALAEAEVEYEDHESDSVFVRFELKKDEMTKKLGVPFEPKAHIMIWTTTPWTLLANVAVAVHPDLEYLGILHNNAIVILAKELYYSLLKEKFGFTDESILFTAKGRDLEGVSYKHPFGLREGKVVLADYVSKEDGTGCVHIAPGHGQEDFMTGLKYRLEVVMPVNERGCFDQTVQEFSGQHVFKANELIIEKLKALGNLQARGKVKHAYPHCWRCKNPIIFRATHQWFLKIDHNHLRQDLLRSIKEDIAWIPPSGQERISAMVENRPDWCLSRQRFWGVPIPAVICKKCSTHILDDRIIEKVADYALQEGTDAWFNSDVSAFMPQNFKCPCGHNEFEKSTDILDVWFDSGVSHQAVLKGKPGMKLPADLYLEGSDQHRGWFQASLIASMGIDNKPPFGSVLTHGFVVDGEGRKMSKSLGNVVAPQEIIKDSGADILRLWVCSSDYNEDVRISKEILTFITDAYRKIRNTVRFLLGNLSDFNPDEDRLAGSEMLVIDRWALHKLSKLIDDVTEGYDTYKFYHVFQRIYSFCNEDMSSLYLDLLKDRLYTAGKRSKLRRSAQTALYEILKSLTRLIAPVLPFTAEEIYKCMRLEADEIHESIHLCSWPKIPGQFCVKENEVKGISEILDFRPTVLKALEDRRAKGEIGSSLEAKVVLTFKDEKILAVFAEHAKFLPYIFIVSQVLLNIDANIATPYEISVSRAQGKKCVRCWNYGTEVDAVKDYPGLCGRCIEAIM